MNADSRPKEKLSFILERRAVTVKEKLCDKLGEDVVSSLTESRPESHTKKSATDIQRDVLKDDNKSATGAWCLYAHGTTHARTQLTTDADVCPDSVQEEAVTTSSETTVTVLKQPTEFREKGITGTLVNYDSSDSDESSVKTPRIENLQEGAVFQYPHSNSKALEEVHQKIALEPQFGADRSGANIEIGAEVETIRKNETLDQNSSMMDGEYEGYWNSDGYWVDSHGQMWEAQESYWHEQTWDWQVYKDGRNQGPDRQLKMQEHVMAEPVENTELGWNKMQKKMQQEVVGTVSSEEPSTCCQDYYQQQYATSSNKQQYQQQYHEPYQSTCKQQLITTSSTGDHSGFREQSTQAHNSCNWQAKQVQCQSQIQHEHIDDDCMQYSYLKNRQPGQATTEEHQCEPQSCKQHYMQLRAHCPEDRHHSYRKNEYDHSHNQHHQYNEQAAESNCEKYSQDYAPQEIVQYNQHQLQCDPYQLPSSDPQDVASETPCQSHSWHSGGVRDNIYYTEYQATEGSWKASDQSYEQYQGSKQHDLNQLSTVPLKECDSQHHPFLIPPPPVLLNTPSHLPIPSSLPPDHQKLETETQSQPHESHYYLPHSTPHSSFPQSTQTHLNTTPASNPPHSYPHSPAPSHPHSYYQHTLPKPYVGDRNCLHSALPPGKYSTNHNEKFRRKWRHYRRECHPSNITPSAKSSPFDSTSSDVSSTSRESPALAQLPGRVRSPLFSRQLRDPRRFSPPVSPRDSRGSNSDAQERTAINTSSKMNSEAKPPSLPRVDSKNKTAEPISYPKSSLSGFRIPKHSKSMEANSKTHSTSHNITTTRGVEARILKKDAEVSTEFSESSGVEIQQGVSVEIVSAQEPEKQSNSEDQNMGVSSVPVRDTTSMSQPVESGGTSQMDLVSLFKSIDSNTLSALASTIQHALGSSNHDVSYIRIYTYRHSCAWAVSLHTIIAAQYTYCTCIEYIYMLVCRLHTKIEFFFLR